MFLNSIASLSPLPASHSWFGLFATSKIKPQRQNAVSGQRGRGPPRQTGLGGRGWVVAMETWAERVTGGAVFGGATFPANAPQPSLSREGVNNAPPRPDRHSFARRSREVYFSKATRKGKPSEPLRSGRLAEKRYLLATTHLSQVIRRLQVK